MASYNFKELESVMFEWTQDSNNIGVMAQEVSEAFPEAFEPKPSNIVLNAGGTEMLKVAEDGFYVRGTKVPVDDKEAATVYNAFKQFLVWAELNRM